MVDTAMFTGSGKKGREVLRIKELYDAGCEIRIYKPKYAGFGFESLHTKTWILDHMKVLSGSVNVTDCGMTGNKEHMFVITEEEVVARLAQDFESTWFQSTELSLGKLEGVLNAYGNRVTARQSRSRSLTREVQPGYAPMYRAPSPSRQEPALPSIDDGQDEE